MSFDLSFPATDGTTTALELQPSEVIYILGANGAGKSSLLQKLNGQNDLSRWIFAHRQNWFPSDASAMNLAQKTLWEEHLGRYDSAGTARYRNERATERTSIALHNLIVGDNRRARQIADTVDHATLEEARHLSVSEPSSISIINEIFQRSQLPIQLHIGDDERLMARREGNCADYGASEMSDGERNALLIAALVLTAPKDALLLIDEPEQHIHRSIAAPLLAHLFKWRRDCGFVIGTHDIELPIGNPNARVVLLRECLFEQHEPQCWAVDELDPGTQIDERLKREVLGARATMLFVEGEEGRSLDKQLYECLFPSVSVIAKGSCAEVERAVRSCGDCKHVHWLKAYGIVDGDGVNDDEIIARKKSGNVYTLPYYSVEAIYVHPKMIMNIAKMKAGELGADADKLGQKAIAIGINAVGKNAHHLSKNRATQIAKRRLVREWPKDHELLTDGTRTIELKGRVIHAEVEDVLEEAISANDWEEILRICPVRESGAKDAIAKALEYRSAEVYEKAVIQLLRRDEEVANFVKGLLGDLSDLLSD